MRQLLERCVRESPDLLTGGAEPAGAVFTATQGDATDAEGLFARLHGLYWLAANLASREPLVLVADDLHWADTASLRWLVFLAERIEDLPVLLVAATRPAEPGADLALLDVLASRRRSCGQRRCRPARPRSWSEPGFRTPSSSSRPLATQATGGNAFLLGELLAELADQGAAGTAAESTGIFEFGSERVGHAVRRRLRLMSDDATAVARSVAVLGPPTPLGDVAALTGAR